MDLGLKDARVFVAASRSGLGEATARQFSREGALVAINGRNADTLQPTANSIQQETGNRIITIPGDISQRDIAASVIQQAADQLGGLDIIVTNAGGPRHGTFDDLKLDDWDHGYELLLTSTIEMIRAALPFLRQSERASILTITSISLKQPIAGLTLSNVFRAGLAGLVKTLANDLGPEGIRVNAILPGWTATARVDELMAAQSAHTGDDIETVRAARTNSIPLRAMGTPEQFGNVAVFLSSPAAGFIQGAMIPVDGGEIKSTM